ncbi:Golgi reassembly-stacking protein 2 [Mortierella sp. GBA30]|nr:Golgi reassembly-stacking protein 2 [Mortierella sp. GBA30]
MGNAASGDEGRYRSGYHVLRVKDGSPAHHAGLRPYFDYIMAVNGIRLDTESNILRDQMELSEDKPMIMDVYSTKEQALRKTEIVPRRNWGGEHEDGLLGCSIRFALFDTIIDIVWHVLDIIPGSPAEHAGLCAHSDYVIGTPLGIMRGEGDLYDLIEDYIGEPLPLHVYNVDKNQVREVVVIPSEDWGGEGLLGCDVGYGYLHRLPKRLSPRLESPMDFSKQLAGQHVKSSKNPVDGPATKEAHDVGAAKSVESLEDKKYTRSPNSLQTEDLNTYALVAATGNGAAKELTQNLLGHTGCTVDGAALRYTENQELEAITPNSISHQDHPRELGTPQHPIAESSESPSVPSSLSTPILYPQESSSQSYPSDVNSANLHPEAGHGQETSSEEKDAHGGEVQISTSERTESAEESLSSTTTTTTTPSLEPSHEAEDSSKEKPELGQPPLALAARMMPGIHGRGTARRGHDGYSSRDKISLQAAQAQAQQQSHEYWAQRERELKSERDDQATADENIQQSTPLIHENETTKNEKDKQERREKEEKVDKDDPNVHEYVVEGMIRHMAMGAIVFPL